MAELQRQNDESRAELERRAAEREANPAAMDAWLTADSRDTGDSRDLCFTAPTAGHGSPQSAPVRRNGGAGGLVYRTQQNASAAAPVAVAVPSNADDWRDEVARGMAGVIVVTKRELRQEYRKALRARDARIAKLEARVETLLAMLGDKAKKGAQMYNDDSVVDVPNWRKRRA